MIFFIFIEEPEDSSGNDSFPTGWNTITKIGGADRVVEAVSGTGRKAI